MTHEQIGIEISVLGFRTFDLLQRREQLYVEPDVPEHVAEMVSIIDEETA